MILLVVVFEISSIVPLTHKKLEILIVCYCKLVSEVLNEKCFENEKPIKFCILLKGLTFWNTLVYLLDPVI